VYALYTTCTSIPYTYWRYALVRAEIWKNNDESRHPKS
jgi:hypothetical protein